MARSPVTSVAPYQRTMRAAHARPREYGQGHGVVEAGELVEAVFNKGTGLSLAAHKALLLLLLKAGGDAWQDREFSISKAELRGSHKANDRLAKVLRELRMLQVTLAVKEDGRISDWDGPVVTITKTHRDDDDGATVRWRFSEIVREALRKSETYADMLESVILPMESGYSLRLYEIGCLYYRRQLPVWRGTKEQLRDMLRVPESAYRDWTDLKRKTLDVAKAELDPVAPFEMVWKITERRGRTVTAVEITFAPKLPHITDKPRRTRKTTKTT